MGYQRRVHGECLLAGSAGYTHSSIMGENPEIWKAAAMADHFDKIQKLTEKIDGVPNFRRVPGYKVYRCGQPTIAGFEGAMKKACGETYPKTNKIIWLNMRQEPIVYVNGSPVCARPPNKIGEYAESKLSYEIMDDAAQAFLKTKIMDNIQKYFYLICFTGYLRDQSKVAKDGITDEDKKAFSLTGGKVSTPTESLKLKDTFVNWMESKKELRNICDEGKGKLQWEREIPQEALDNLNNLATTDFKANLGKIIHDIYLTGHNMFKDMPQGDHKKRAKYRFASKTLMRILPNELKAEVE